MKAAVVVCLLCAVGTVFADYQQKPGMRRLYQSFSSSSSSSSSSTSDGATSVFMSSSVTTPEGTVTKTSTEPGTLAVSNNDIMPSTEPAPETPAPVAAFGPAPAPVPGPGPAPAPGPGMSYAMLPKFAPQASGAPAMIEGLDCPCALPAPYDASIPDLAGYLRANADCPPDPSPSCPQGNYGVGNVGGCGQIGCYNQGTNNVGSRNQGTGNRGNYNQGTSNVGFNNTGTCLMGSYLVGTGDCAAQAALTQAG